MRRYDVVPFSLSNTLHRRDNEYFGRYRGIVLDNEDPYERGRCKVFVYGVYDDSFNKDNGRLLPWAEPCQPLFCGGMGSDGENGTFQLPDLGSTVWVFFDSGDITRPVMFGQTTDANGKFSTKHCKLKWEKMHIDLYRDFENNTNVISISADTDINETAHTNNYNLYAGTNINDTAGVTINVKSLSGDINVDALSGDINVDALSGNINVFAENGIINVQAKTEINITSPKVNITGDTTIKGKCHITDATEIDSTTIIHSSETVDSDATIGGKSFLEHTHGNGNEGGNTFKPN